MMEALVCHPLGKGIERPVCESTHALVDTIKVRMQLSRRARAPGVSTGFS